MAELFEGLDSQCDVSVIFYLRPQLQWIPSAWKQWDLKTGASLTDFVAQCVDTRTPAFKRDIESWKSTLPTANIHVRFLIPELLAGGNPAHDFLNLLGLSEKQYEFESEARNPSLDVSVLHVLSKNPHLFSDVHDNNLTLRACCRKSFDQQTFKCFLQSKKPASKNVCETKIGGC